MSHISLQSPRPDVLHITEPFSFGCLTALSNIVSATAENGLHHAVAHGTARAMAGAEALFPQGTRFFPVPSLRREISLQHDWAAWCALNKLIQALRPRLIHCHSSKAGVLGRLAARWHGIPSLYTPHGFSFLQENAPIVQRTIFKGIEWIMARTGNALVACGQQEYDIARTLSPQCRQPLFIPNALSTSLLDEIRAEKPQSQPQKPRAGLCGRVTFARNSAWVQEAARATSDSITWKWIGGGEKAQALSHTIASTPCMEHKAALREMQQLDMYVQPSRWEGLSFSLLEAMYLGKPVIASRIPANAAVIHHGETGFLVNNATELIQCVQKLAADPSLRARIGAAAHDYAAQKHDSRIVYQKYTEIYSNLASEK
ncbi:MAG: glycosyltransferase [Desulfovibrionaceae bacterium]|nr:glycosyltransferase [Desulfovibrionaceae bacterium]